MFVCLFLLSFFVLFLFIFAQITICTQMIIGFWTFHFQLSLFCVFVCRFLSFICLYDWRKWNTTELHARYNLTLTRNTSSNLSLVYNRLRNKTKRNCLFIHSNFPNKYSSIQRLHDSFFPSETYNHNSIFQVSFFHKFLSKKNTHTQHTRHIQNNCHPLIWKIRSKCFVSTIFI